MRRTIVTLAAASISVLFGSTALAQRPTIIPEPIAEADLQLNVAEVEADARIQIAWTAQFPVFSGLENFRYQLTYETHRTNENREAELVRIEDVDFGGRNEDRQFNGERIVVFMRPSEILPLDALPEAGNPRDETTRSIALKVFERSNEFDMLQFATFQWDFQYDTKAPGKPIVSDFVIPGENRLELNWSSPGDSDIESYSIVYCPDVREMNVDTSSTSTTTGVLPCSDPLERTNIDGTFATGSAEEGLQIGVPAALAVRAVDRFGNTGPLSNVVIGTPADVNDFWELYKTNGGSEDGGFCFIATAAYGSYAHPTVKIFRWFRDTFLMPTAPGRALVGAYYEHSPPIAMKIAKDEDLAAMVRLGLVFVVFLMVFGTGLAAFGFVWGLGRLVGRFSKVSAALALAFCLLPSAAEAKRPDSVIDAFGIGFEFKGGPYLPDIGNDGGGTEGNPAFNQIYGSNPNELFTLGGEVQLYRGFGTAGVGATFGFMQFVGRAIYAENAASSRDTTVFNIAPFSLTANYRFDWLADQIPFPLVPYIKGGLAYYLWWITTGTGDVARVEQAGSGADDQIGRGGKWGLTGTLGISILLNVIEPTAAQSLYANTGVRGTYLFAEVQGNKVDGFGADGFDLSDTTWNLGIFIEM